jgi:DNA-binding transcriptional MerR regulator
MTDEYFGISAVADAIGRSAERVRQLITQGVIPEPPRAFGRRIWSAKDIERIKEAWGKRNGSQAPTMQEEQVQ